MKKPATTLLHKFINLLSSPKQMKKLPPQHQSRQPGLETAMHPAPETLGNNYRGSSRLLNKIAIITGGDSGIGRAVAYYFALEGADIVITYLNENVDADNTRLKVQELGRRCLSLAGDIGDPHFCQQLVKKVLTTFGNIDILVNNAAEQHVQKEFLDITLEQWENTFRTNIFAYFYMAKYVLPHMRAGCSIINTTSVTAYQGHPKLIDYSATKGAIVSFTRSLAKNLAKKNIRVNAVAPGPIWTPLIPSTFSPEEVREFGAHVPMERPGQPSEVAPCYVFLASDDASYITGQVLHPNGGTIING